MHRCLAVLALLFFVLPVATWGCICSQTTPGKCPGLEKDDNVFLGTVLEAVRVPPSDAKSAEENAAPLIRYHFRIDERFAGPNASEIDIYSGGEDGDCGYRFKQGVQYVVFTEQGTEGRLFATICNGTRPASDALALLPQLRSMRDGKHVASVFGVLRRAEPPTLATPDDPDDPLPNVALKLRSHDDRFTADTDVNGVYSFYDVHAGEYEFTADLPADTQLSQRTLVGPLPLFKLPDGACYEFNVDALPTGHIEGTISGPDGKPLRLASLELYRAGTYNGSRSGLWTFQGSKGVFDFDHIGPGQYIVVYNRGNRMDPNSPFPRTFYPGTEDLSQAKPIEVKESEQLDNLNFSVGDPFPTRKLRVHLEWKDGRPPGSVFLMAKGDKGDNPAPQKIEDGVYEFTLLEAAHYTISAWEQLDPARSEEGSGATQCVTPARIDSDAQFVDGADANTSEITLSFSSPPCHPPQP